MTTVDDIMEVLAEYGSPSIKKVLMNHGAQEPFFGVKIGDMKKILKTIQIKKDHQLSLGLYATGNSDAMYLAMLIADEKKISKDDLRLWVSQAYWYMLSEYAVAWIAAESPFGEELGLEWIDSPEAHIQAAGWCTLANWLALRSNSELDIALYEGLLDRVGKGLQASANRVKYTMNNFIIALGSQVPELTAKCLAVADRIGKVEVEMGGTACKVPQVAEYIAKIESMGRIGKKKKMARC
jgi:3-methyladenine DNA glycosylase AlkD